MTEEQKRGLTVVKLWNTVGKEAYKASISNDMLKTALFSLWTSTGEIKPKAKMQDLHATYFDATEIYDFLATTVCK